VARLQDASSMGWRVETRTMVPPRISCCSSSDPPVQWRAIAMSLHGAETYHGLHCRALRGTTAPLRRRDGWHDDALRQGDARDTDCAHAHRCARHLPVLCPTRGSCRHGTGMARWRSWLACARNARRRAHPTGGVSGKQPHACCHTVSSQGHTFWRSSVMTRRYSK
jgi:hypothetical protein